MKIKTLGVVLLKCLNFTPEDIWIRLKGFSTEA
jgi:hypothetical protein